MSVRQMAGTAPCFPWNQTYTALLTMIRREGWFDAVVAPAVAAVAISQGRGKVAHWIRNRMPAAAPAEAGNVDVDGEPYDDDYVEEAMPLLDGDAQGGDAQGGGSALARRGAVPGVLDRLLATAGTDRSAVYAWFRRVGPNLVARLLVHPVMLAWTRRKVYGAEDPERYGSLVAAMQTVVAEEGPLSLWKGLSMVMPMVVVQPWVSKWSLGGRLTARYFRNLEETYFRFDGTLDPAIAEPHRIATAMLCLGVTALVQNLANFPLRVLTVRMMAEESTRYDGVRGPLTAARDIFDEGGLTGFFRGALMHSSMIAPFVVLNGMVALADISGVTIGRILERRGGAVPF